VDSLVLHSPVFPYDHLLRVWGAMEEVYHSGGALQLGISNCYDLELLKKLYGNSVIKPTIVQNRFYTESDYDVELRQWCDNHDIIYQSFWSLTANPHILKSDMVQQLSEKYTKTPAQIWYRYLSHVGIVPLIGSTSRHHLDEDLNIFTFDLSRQEQQQVSVLLH
jgi:diketogulonate reductase-like aldo/keto reductase